MKALHINIPWAQPEEDYGMSFVNIRNAKGGKHEEQKNVAENEVCSEQAKFRDLAEKFATGLRDRMPAQVVPFPSPPCDVGGVMSKFPR